MAFEIDDQLKKLEARLEHQKENINIVSEMLCWIKEDNNRLISLLENLQAASVDSKSKTVVDAKSDPETRNRPPDCIKETIELIDGKIKPEDVLKLLPKIYKYIALMKDGEWRVFQEKPIIDEDEDWESYSDKGSHENWLDVLDIDYTGNWQDSLFERP